MGVQDGRRSAGPDDLEMQASFRGGPPFRPATTRAAAVDVEKIRTGELALVRAARRDGQSQRPRRDHRAEVSAGPGHPVAAVEQATHFRELAATSIERRRRPSLRHGWSSRAPAARPYRTRMILCAGPGAPA